MVFKMIRIKCFLLYSDENVLFINLKTKIMNKWYIGQDIVCVKTHPQYVIEEGQIFTIKGLRNGCCKSSFNSIIEIDVSINQDYCKYYCEYCNSEEITDVHWFNETRFKSLDELIDISEIEEILTQKINY